MALIYTLSRAGWLSYAAGHVVFFMLADRRVLVMGVGTGGTLMGVGRAIRKAKLKARIFAVEPDESAVMSGDKPGEHGIQGLADGFIPEIIKLPEIDDIVRIKTASAQEEATSLTRLEGMLVGISSGANLLAAKKVARRLGPGHTIVTMLPDRGERYLSMKGSSPCYPRFEMSSC